MMIRPPAQVLDGYCCYTTNTDESPDTTTDSYASIQDAGNVRKTTDFLLPLLKMHNANSVLDVGCGTGTMVSVLLENNFESFGVDLAGLAKYWQRRKLSKDRFFIVDHRKFELPFEDNSLDFVFSFGVIEHVGTSNGHTDRLPDYKGIRGKWLREVYRTVRVGGHLLVGGPNRNFPIDVAHPSDTRCTRLERFFSRLVRRSVHFPWNDSFLWNYNDVGCYLKNLPHNIKALSIKDYLYMSRVPKMIKPVVSLYVNNIPSPLLRTGLNPWVMALIEKRQADQEGTADEGRTKFTIRTTK